MEGLTLLDGQNRISEIPNLDQRYSRIASYYAESPKETRIVSPDNESLAGINQAVRQESQQRGFLSENRYEARVLVAVRDIREYLGFVLVASQTFGDELVCACAGTIILEAALCHAEKQCQLFSR